MSRVLLGKNIEELKEVFASLGEKSFRASQLNKALFLGLKFSEITEFSLSLRQKLSEIYVDQPTEIIKSYKSKEDETEKFLFLLIKKYLL